MAMYHSSSSVVITNKTPSGTKRHCKCIETESHQTAKIFHLSSFSSFSSSSSSSDGLVKNCMITNIFTLSRSNLHWAVHQPIAFSQLRSNLTQHSKDALKYGFIWDAILWLYTCTQNSHVTVIIVSTAGLMTRWLLTSQKKSWVLQKGRHTHIPGNILNWFIFLPF